MQVVPGSALPRTSAGADRPAPRSSQRRVGPATGGPMIRGQDPQVTAKSGLAGGRAVVALSQDERHTLTAVSLSSVADARNDIERQRLLHDVTRANMPIARSIARRYRGRGLNEEDLEQVAYLALVYAVRHFDPTRGNDFLSYAVPTIRGFLKKHFRDQGWAVRPPRRIQELQGTINAARDQLTQAFGRSPRPAEIAEHLDVHVESVLEALAADGCFAPASLDRPVGDDASSTVGDLIPDSDRGSRDGQETVEARLMLAPALRRLDPRARRILYLRFFEDRTQQEIADDIGVTQMHVSRLITRITDDLRAELSLSTQDTG